MAFVNLNNSYPRQFLLALRNGRMCCAVCCQKTDTFSRNGLQQHYRMTHKNLEFSENAVRVGVRALRNFVAEETRENLVTLSEKRSESVGVLTFIILLYYILYQTITFLIITCCILFERMEVTRFSTSKALESTWTYAVQTKGKLRSYLVFIWTINIRYHRWRIVAVVQK
jgi:hypothetical protein